jgi:colanic acid biosynthesis glycosyl transferase WcaI
MTPSIVQDRDNLAGFAKLREVRRHRLCYTVHEQHGEPDHRAVGGLGAAMRKKILLLTQFFPPETAAGANRTGPMAEVLSRYHDVLVITLKPSYPSPRAYKGFSPEQHDTKRPYTVKRTFGFHPHRGSLLLRTLREQLMALCLAVRGVPASVDIVVVSSPSMFLGTGGLALARAKGAKFVWDVRDITWGYAKEAAGTSPAMAFAARVLEKYILFVLRRADLVVGASSGITRTLVESGIASRKTITIPNGISTQLLNDIVQNTPEKIEKQRPVVTYAGVIGYNQGMVTLVDVARILVDVDFVLVGDGPELPVLRKRAKELGVKNISFRGYLNRKDLLEVFRESDILLAHVKSTPVIDATMVPIKLFEYMATGRPIVYAGKGTAVDLLHEIGCAVTVPPEDPEALSATIVTLLRDSQRMRALGSKGRSYVRHNFHREKLMEELAYALRERF